MSRFKFITRLLLFGSMFLFLQSTASLSLYAQSGDGTAEFMTSQPTLTEPEQPDMAYQPPAQADDLSDFLPPGGIHIDTPLSVLSPATTATTTPITITQPVTNTSTDTTGDTDVVTIPLTTTSPLTPAIPVSQASTVAIDGRLPSMVSFNGGTVTVVMEENTFVGSTELQFTSTAAPAYDLTATNNLSNPVDSLILQKFQLEVVENGDEVTGEFARPVRLVVDLRPLMKTLDPSYQTWSYFLAYRDENDPLVWIEVPIDVYQPDGLISAEVMHFSDWASGVRPERWNPSWTPPAVSAFSGAATYNYPIEVPPGRHGLQPGVALSYSSRAIDGRIRDAESGPIADGWSLAEISVVRVGVELEEFYGTPRTVHPDKFRLVFNGTGHEIYPVAGANTATDPTVRYYVKDAPGYFLERNYSASTPNTDGIYWILITPDGMRYRLGYFTDAEEWQHVAWGGNIIVYGHTGHDQGGQEYSAIAWHVDTVTDSFGNQMTYHYHTQNTTENIRLWYDGWWINFDLTTRIARINTIKYNYPDRVTSLPASDTVARLASTPGTRIEFRPSNTINGDFQFLINSIFIYHGSGALPITEYRINTQGMLVDSPGCINQDPEPDLPRQSHTRIVTFIQRYVGTDGDATTNDAGYALPATTFTHTYKPHFYKNNQACFQFYYLTGYQNGYGGSMSFTYASDNRSVGDYIIITYDRYVWPAIGYNYFVTNVSSSDGRNPTINTAYAYTQPCYGQWQPVTAPAVNCAPPNDAPEYGNLVGHQTTTQTNYDYNGTTVLNRQVTTFSQNATNSIGRPTRIDVKNASNTVLTRTDNTYATVIFANGGGSNNDDATFTYTSETKNYQYNGSNTLSNKTTYEYNTANQGNVFYGNLTHIREYDDAADTTPYRTTARWFYPNASSGYWMVGQLGTEALYSGNMTTLIRGVWNHYDGAGNQTTPPTQGSLTRSRMIIPITCSVVPGGGGSGCTYARQTIDTVSAYSVFGNQTSIITYSDYGYRTFNSGWGDLVNIYPSNGRTTTIAYETGYNLYPTSATNPLNQTTTFQTYGFNGVAVDGFQKQPGLLKQVTGIDNTTIQYEYDVFGRLHAVFDGYSSSGFGDPDPWNGDPVELYRYWDNTWQNPTIFLNPAGNAPFVITTQKRPASYLPPANSSSGFAFNEQVFMDGFGRPIQTRSVWNWVEGQSLSREIITSTVYGANGQVSCQTAPYDVPFYTDRGLTWPASPFITTGCTSKPHTASTYDALGRPVNVTAPNNAITNYTYYIVNSVTVDGRNILALTNIKDGNNHITSQLTNSLGQLAMVQEISGTDPYTAYADTRYYYDIQGNLTKVTQSNPSSGDPGTWLAQTLMTYDDFGRKTAMNDPDMGNWTYTYDAASNLTTQVDANLARLCFYYDTLNRLTHERHDNDNNGCETNDTQLAYYAYFTSGTGDIGKLSEIRWSSSSTDYRETFNYDTLGRLTTHNRWIDGRQYTLAYSSFDAFHRPTSRTLTWPNANTDTVTMTFDHEGENTLSGGGNSLIEAVGYNDHGQLKRIALANGLTTWFGYSGYEASANNDTYDAKEVTWSWGAGADYGALWRICTAPDANTRCQAANKDQPVSGQVFDLRMGYDQVGNVIAVRDYINSNQVQSFSYDHLNRLESASTNAVGDGQYTHSGENNDYDYDKLGNITAFGNTTTYIYNSWHASCTNPPAHPMPHAVKKIGSNYYCYDKNGNMTKRVEGSTTTTQNFNVENEMSSVVVGSNTTSFSYDVAGIRVKTVEPTGKTVYYPFPGYEEEIVGSATNRRITYSIAGQAIALRKQVVGGSNTLYYLHTDHLGSTSLATTTDGSIVTNSTARYYPFGDWRTEPTAGLTDRGFTGHIHDNTGSNDIGLIYMNARYYVPGIGKFASADIIVPNPANPQTYNRYSYVNNNPLSFVDPSGHCATYTYVEHGIEQQLPDMTNDAACWEEYNNLINAGVPTDVIGSGADYQQRSDIEILLGVQQEYNLDWAAIWNYVWGADGADTRNRHDDRACVSFCLRYYERVGRETENGWQFVTANGESLYLIHSLTKEAVFFASDSETLRGYIDDWANANRQMFIAESVFVGSLLAAAGSGLSTPVTGPVGVGGTLVFGGTAIASGGALVASYDDAFNASSNFSNEFEALTTASGSFVPVAIPYQQP